MATIEQVEKALRAADAAGNTDDARRLAAVYKQMQSPQKADFSDVNGGVLPDPQRSVGQDLGRAAIMTGRSVLHGVLGLPEMLHDATVMPAYNAIASAVGSDSRIAPGAQQIDGNLNALGVPNPQPENATERVVSGIDRGLGGLITGAGIGSAAANSTNAVARGVGGALTSNLGA
jgi:hypothetical protein